MAFSYSLSTKGRSSRRVALWRRLKRLGAISPTGGTYLLPEGPENLEAFQWLLQEVKSAGGEALVMSVSNFEGLGEAHLREKFNDARGEEYDSLEAELIDLESGLSEATVERRLEALDALEKLRRRHAEVARVDFFKSPRGASLATRIAHLAQRLVSDEPAEVEVEAVDKLAFRGKVWVTRPNPHVDRLASIWLIRQFVDPDAEIRYRDKARGEEVSFDMPGARFGHVENLCTFETLLAAFGLSDAGLLAVAEIVHEIDLRDGRCVRPEVIGVDAVLAGWRRLDLSDDELETHGVTLFEGLYTSLLEQHMAVEHTSGERIPVEERQS